MSGFTAEEVKAISEAAAAGPQGVGRLAEVFGGDKSRLAQATALVARLRAGEAVALGPAGEYLARDMG